jgi:hypothetical protein
MLVGWKQFFKMTSDNFKSYFDNAQRWGDLIPIKITLGDKVYYTVGLYGMPPEGSEITGYTPRIACPWATQLRITVKLIFLIEAGTPLGCEGAIFIFPYKNGDLATNAGYGYTFPVKQTPNVNVGELHEFVVEISGNQLIITVDGARLSPVPLNPPVQSFSLLLALRRYYMMSEPAERPVEPQQQDGLALAIYEIIGEYYDQWEDLFSMMAQMIHVAMFIAIGVMLLITVFKVFTSR